MNTSFERKYNLRYFEMNNYGEASPAAIATLLEETAAEHCHSIGYGLYELEKQNIGWVLLSGVVEMVRYPRYRENIYIKTWLSKYSRVKGFRENIIFDEERNIIGKARGLWVFFDIEKRKPVPIFEDIKTKWNFTDEISVDENFEYIDQTDDGCFNNEFKIHRSDIDSNDHVNNIRYFNFLMNSIPEEVLDGHYLKNLNVKFLNEAKYGDKIQVYVDDNLGNGNFLHVMKSSVDGRILAKAHTQWAQR